MKNFRTSIHRFQQCAARWRRFQLHNAGICQVRNPGYSPRERTVSYPNLIAEAAKSFFSFIAFTNLIISILLCITCVWPLCWPQRSKQKLCYSRLHLLTSTYSSCTTLPLFCESTYFACEWDKPEISQTQLSNCPRDRHCRHSWDMLSMAYYGCCQRSPPRRIILAVQNFLVWSFALVPPVAQD